jgi:hypothetical protein
MRTNRSFCVVLSLLLSSLGLYLLLDTIHRVGKFPDECILVGATLAKTLQDRRVERRSEVRVRLRVPVKLQGRDSAGNPFDIRTVTENVSKSGFLCACNLALENNAIVEVSIAASKEELVGSARVVRSEWTDALYPRYGFQFIQKTGSWVLD